MQIVRKLDVVYGDRSAVVPADARSQAIGPCEIVGGVFPLGGETGSSLPAFVNPDERELHEKFGGLIRGQRSLVGISVDRRDQRITASVGAVRAATATRGAKGEQLQQPGCFQNSQS